MVRGRRSDRRVLSYNCALELTGCESIEATLRARRLLWAGALTHIDDGRFTMRVMLGAIKDGGQERTGWAKDRVGGMRGKRRPVFQDPTKLETRRPRCPELDRNSHRGRAEVHDRVEEGGSREAQNRQKRTAK